MPERIEYWADERNTDYHWGAAMEMRANMAMELVMRWGTVAASFDGEDSAGRNRMVNMPPADLVKRAFEIATLFIGEAESRGFLRKPTMTLEQQNLERGKLKAIEKEETDRAWNDMITDRAAERAAKKAAKQDPPAAAAG